MKQEMFLRLLIPGGILSREDLEKIILLARKHQLKYLQFGLRQDILIALEYYKKDDVLLTLKDLDIRYEFNTPWSRNVTTSLAACNILPNISWLTEDTYLDLLDALAYEPHLRINIVDPYQGLVPLFTGHLNFIASQVNNYWYLKLDLPEWFPEMKLWPGLIYTDDIWRIANKLEELYEKRIDLSLEDIFHLVMDELHINGRKLEPFSLPDIRLPYYEGFNKYGSKYWLGIYKRSYSFPVSFLEAIAQLCYQTANSKIFITPWRSILIQNIAEKDWLKWIKLLGKFDVNIRHSAVELNWRIPDLDEEALELKKYLVSEFDKNDMRTYGLTFAIRTQKVDLDAAVVIDVMEKDKGMPNPEYIYKIYHSKNFEPNSKEYQLYRENLSFGSLASNLMQLIKYYYEQLNNEEEIITVLSSGNEGVKNYLYQCDTCLTVYDPKYGDMEHNIAPGTAFKDLPLDYHCPVCDDTVEHYKLIKDLSLSA